MPLRLKFDVLAKLKEQGYTTYGIRKRNLFNENTLTRLRDWQNWKDNKGISWASIATICELLNCQPADFMEYVSDN